MGWQDDLLLSCLHIARPVHSSKKGVRISGVLHRKENPDLETKIRDSGEKF